MKMKNKTILIAVSFILGACNSVPKGFCDCLTKSEKLNKLANEVLLGGASEAKTKEMIEARNQQAKACENFKTTSGDQMQKWKRECENH